VDWACFFSQAYARQIHDAHSHAQWLCQERTVCAPSLSSLGGSATASLDITTRQQIELRGFTLDTVPENF